MLPLQDLSTVYSRILSLQTPLQLLVTNYNSYTSNSTNTRINIITITSNSAIFHYKLGPAQKIIKNNLFKSKRYDTLI